MKNLNYLMVHILYQNFKTILKKTRGGQSTRIYANRIENRIMFKVKTGYYLELITPETMKLLGSTKSKTTKDENSESVPYLEIAEVILIHCNVVNKSSQ